MAKNGTVQNPLPFRDRFTKWLIDEGYTKESAGSYASYINKSLNSKVLRRLSRNGISAFDAYPASLSFDDLLQITSRYLDLISDSAISFEIDPGTLAKCRSALLAYVEYLYIHKDNLKEKFPDCQNKLKELRESHNLLQRQVAAGADMDSAVYCKIEKGERQAHEEQVRRLAEFYNIPFEELRRFWLASKVYGIVAEESDANSILNIVAEEMAQYKCNIKGCKSTDLPS